MHAEEKQNIVTKVYDKVILTKYPQVTTYQEINQEISSNLQSFSTTLEDVEFDPETYVPGSLG